MFDLPTDIIRSRIVVRRTTRVWMVDVWKQEMRVQPAPVLWTKIPSTRWPEKCDNRKQVNKSSDKLAYVIFHRCKVTM